MSNTNALIGVRCPECRQESVFDISVTARMRVTDEGAWDLVGGTTEWFEDSHIICGDTDCSHDGSVDQFTYPEGYELMSLEDETDDDENGEARVTPAGSRWEVINLDGMTRMLGCPATGATIFIEVGSLKDSFKPAS